MRKVNQNRIIYTVLITICIVGFWWFENYYEPNSKIDDSSEFSGEELPEFIIPKSPDGELVKHNYYTLSYAEDYEQPNFVVYRLDRSHLTYEDRERPYFEKDPKVSTGSADWKNYRGSGYDRGHLCPAGDRRFSDYAYEETFYTSNISPQDKDFNAGVWNRLEKQIRRWAKRYNSVYVITAGVLDESLPIIGEERVAVPRFFYKVVARGDSDDLKVITFLIPHRDSERPLEYFVIPLDEIERRTGIDFFHTLDDDLEAKIESGIELQDWKF